MRYVVTDLEATCWENDKEFQRENSEIIEVGAVALDTVLKETKELQLYIQPTKYPKLTDYCTQLTGITQEVVDRALKAPDAYDKLYHWLVPRWNKSVMVSWGNYDWYMLKKEMEDNMRVFPFRAHINLKTAFSQWERSKPKGLHRAIESLGLKFEGRHHSGLDDAKNAATILKHLLKKAPNVLQLSKLG